ACDNCRRRKVKCDGVRPSCNKCIQLRIQCAYQPRNQKRKQRQGYIEKLENRLLEMERLLRTQTEAANAAAAVAAVATDPNMATQFAQMSGVSDTTSLMHQAMLGIMQDYNAPPADLDLRLASPKVHGIQSVIFLGIFEYAQGRASTAWVYMGMATRMAQSLKLHRLDDPALASRRQEEPEDWVAQETKRRTWWVCYLADRTGAMAAGVPSAIDSRDIAVSL
ncbi:fungal-specific transcription factor domain-containing protein, partial [Syncephalis pseudoplumigaleata]